MGEIMKKAITMKELKKLSGKKMTKELKLKLKYHKSVICEEQGLYFGGVDDPKHQKELAFNITEDSFWDLEKDEFVPNGMYALEISGTDRALMEFGKFLINIAMYETKDPSFHCHIDDIKNNAGKPEVNITVYKGL